VKDYLGIVIEQCLRDPSVEDRLRLISKRKPRSWVFLLVSVPESELDDHVKLLQSQMIEDDAWYAHYFRDDELVVVFRDAVFRVGTDPKTWDAPVEHGIKSGIPLHQMDFDPRTEEDARRFFGLRI
jgi:hypothetical protein